MSNPALESVNISAEPAAASSTTGSDIEWVQETLEGNPQAFGNIIEKYRPKFLRMATRMLKNQEEAEDALQDAFMAAFRNLSSFQNKARFSTWFYSIVLNHVHNRLRRQKIIRWVPIDGMYDHDEEPRTLELPEKEISGDIILEQQLEIEEIKRIVDQFSLQYRTIFILHYFNGLNLEQIAEQLNRPLGTIKAYLHRARKQLQKALASKTSVNK